MDCGFIFDKFQSMKDEPLKTCPECSGNVKRLIGAGAGPIFKGSGFYQTDYKNSKSISDKQKPSESKTTSDLKVSTDKS